jgi:hypothetical protein
MQQNVPPMNPFQEPNPAYEEVLVHRKPIIHVLVVIT